MPDDRLTKQAVAGKAARQLIPLALLTPSLGSRDCAEWLSVGRPTTIAPLSLPGCELGEGMKQRQVVSGLHLSPGLSP